VESYQQRDTPTARTGARGRLCLENQRQRSATLAKAGEEENYAADHNIGKQGIEGYYEKALHGTTGYQEVEVDNHGRVRLLKRCRRWPGRTST
jgi:penicillin-binding protein 2